MAKNAEVARAPRGTKILIKAFFAAADEIPEPNRGAVVKAAFSGIRDELKALREKAALTKAKAKASTSKAALPKPARKASSVARPTKAAPAPGKTKAKKVAPKKPADKSTTEVIEMPTLDAVLEAQK